MQSPVKSEARAEAMRGNGNARSKYADWLAQHNITFTPATRIRLEFALNELQTVNAVKAFIDEKSRPPESNAELREYVRRACRLDTDNLDAGAGRYDEIREED